MCPGRMFHIAAEEVSNKRISYLIVQFLLCTRVVGEADLNGLDSSGLIYQSDNSRIYIGIIWCNSLYVITNNFN